MLVSVDSSKVQKIDHVGSYDENTFVYSAGNLTIPAGTFKRFGPISFKGYKTAIGAAKATSTSVSVNWKTSIAFAAYNSTAITGNVNPQATVNGTAVASAGTQTSIVAPTTIVWPVGVLEVSNIDTTNALTIEYATTVMNV